MRKVLNSGKVYTEQDKKALMDFLEEGKEIPFGKEYREFEKKLAEYVGVKHAFFVNSGSSANLLALAVFTSYRNKKLNKGDEVITLAASFPTTVFPIVQVGCVPVFVDIDIETLNVNVDLIEKAVTPRTKAIMMANTLGNPMALDKIEEICDKHGLVFINDCCDSLGSTYKGKTVFQYGDVATLSMYAAHHIFTGSGGAVFTNDDHIASLIRSYRGWGRGSCVCDLGEDNKCGHRFSSQHGNMPFGYDHKNIFVDMGYNLVATNIQAVLGLSQLSRADEFTSIRIRNFEYLDSYIKNSPILRDKFIFWEKLPGATVSYFGFPLILEEGNRTELAQFLEANGVQTRYLFAGNIAKQPCFSDDPDVVYRIASPLTNTDKIMNDLVWVGCWHGLSIKDMEYIGQTLEAYFADKA